MPFIEEWLEYHFRLGFDRIHLVSTDDSCIEIEELIRRNRFASSIELYRFDDFKPGWQIGCYNACLPFIQEDWLMVLDADEFLYLNSYPKIQDFLDSVPNDVGQVQLPWLNVISKRYFHEHTFDALTESKTYVSNHVKSLVRRKHVTGLGIHSHGIRDLKNVSSAAVELPEGNVHDFAFKNPGYYEEHPFVLHFFSRGHFDVFNRIVDHRFFNAKNGPVEIRRLHDFLTGNPDWENMPTRYLIMQFYRTLPSLEKEFVLPALNAKTDVSTLSRIFLSNIKEVVDFCSADTGSLGRDFEDQYQFVRKLALMDLPEIWSHDDYLGCSSQLEYIERLRNLLTASI